MLLGTTDLTPYINKRLDEDDIDNIRKKSFDKAKKDKKLQNGVIFKGFE